MDILTINDRLGHYPPSYYAASARAPDPFPVAQGELRGDVCIVGGGFTGLSAAIHLARAGMDVILIDASRVGFGASGRNGGQAGTGQRADQQDLEKRHGLKEARMFWDVGLEAAGLVKSLIEQSGNDCAYRPGIIHADHKSSYADEHKAHVEHMNRVYDYDKISFLDKDAIREEVASGVYHSGSLDLGGGHLHPLKFVFALTKLAQEAGVRIFEKSRMSSFESGAKVTVKTSDATITADHLLLALNGYHNNIDKRLASYVMPINNYIAVTEPLGEARAHALIPGNHAIADSKFVVNYFRLSEDHRMIFGGGESYTYRFPRDIKANVCKHMLKIFPQLEDTKIDYAWGGTLGITRSRLPNFQRLEKNIISTAGFSGYGVAMGTMAGKMAADTINGQAGQFDLFEKLPNSPFPGGNALRSPLLIAAMTWYSLRDKL